MLILCRFVSLLALFTCCVCAVTERDDVIARVRRQESPSFLAWIKSKFSKTPTPRIRPESGSMVAAPRSLVVPASDTRVPLVLCSWNIFRFGPAKFSVPDLLVKQGLNVTRMDIIVDQLVGCDIAAIQEYMDLSLVAIGKLRTEMISRTGHQFAIVCSPRVGKNKSFEQYVFIYRVDKVQPLESHLYPDSPANQQFVRDPFFTKFRLLGSQKGKTGSATEFVLGTIHTAPDEAVPEIRNLLPSFDWAVQNFSNADVLVLGDYNAACTYVRPSDWPRIPLRTESRFTWIVPDTMDTTSMTTHCAYDRAVYLGTLFRNAFVSVVAPDFPLKFGLTPAQAKLVSDHRLVRMEFRF
ncbi:putative Deoxyribonuclease-1 [Hypsibius exemplaris]|uniref:Deoxyribonuclease-1 n=1 Tax=Hypsibius exemplaris TaxID=2072580 RepID=A0A1W0WEG2_HYPEX|nr:putative Deoxyribonuclease-1 [Hypsibius exemplaris]